MANTNSTIPVVINITLVKCLISDSRGYGNLLLIVNEIATLNEVNIFIKFLNFTKNHIIGNGISLNKLIVHFIAPFYICNNTFKFSVMTFQSCDISFSGTVTLHKNYCNEIISVDNHIKIFEYMNISFMKNRYRNNLLVVKSTEKYNQPYPLCLCNILQ